MKIKKKYLLLCVMFCSSLLSSLSYGQKKTEALTVGDQCPDLAFNNIVNFKREKANLSDFKGKLVILDFWATWCGSCIAAMPVLDSLQKKYQDKIVVLPVTYQGKEKIVDFFKGQRVGKTVKLPSVVEDTVLKRLFPYITIPHQVWINGNGKVIAITSYAEATEANIELALNGKLSLMVKKDRQPNFEKPIFLNRFGENFKFTLDQIDYQSTILDYIPNMGAGFAGFQILNDKIFVSYTNCLIPGIYSYAFAESTKKMYKKPDFGLASSFRVIVEVKDSSMFVNLDWTKPIKMLTEEEYKGKAFSFEMILPARDSANLKKYMIEDLNRYFGRRYGIKGSLEKRSVTCWILKRTTPLDLLKTKEGKYQFEWPETVDRLKIRNAPLREMVFYFTFFMFAGRQAYPYPFIDETGYQGNIDLDLETDLKNPRLVSEALKKYGLEIILQKRNIDMVVLKNVE